MAEDVRLVGDVQGYCSVLSRLLRESGLIDHSGQWTGGSATLVVAGDLVDRGPDGVGVIQLLMDLQLQGGHVRVVIGNHDVQLLAAHRFGGSMVDAWLDAGGVREDLERLTSEHVEWLSNLPALSLIDHTLVVHADAMFYTTYGSTPGAVNARVREVLSSANLSEWQLLLERFGEHRAFFGANGEANLAQFLTTFGGERLVHGHTPIARMLGIPPESVTSAYVYRDGRCVNVDPGIYLGGPGFSHLLD
ncbi:MAG: metallophosphoesterase [Chloroflexi bacterium]|nr:metallophosphoesterase [Chloroflexota bacterium]